MKTPIEVKDIRKGDLIRCEVGAAVLGQIAAVEYAASHDEHRQFSDGQHYLLHRPTPPVELPTEPTLGWLTTSDCSSAYDKVPIGVPVLDIWKAARYPGISLDRNGKSCGVSNGMVTAFTPAVAVPASALDELRAYFGKHPRLSSTVNRFFAAVDAANGDAS